MNIQPAKVINVDHLVEAMEGTNGVVDSKNHPLLPQHNNHQSYRWLCVAKSGGGKTNMVISAILQQQIRFDHLYLVATSPDQPKYRLLIKWINSLEKQFKKSKGEDVSMMTVITKVEDVPDLEDVNPEIANLMLIDDFIMEKNQEVFCDWFVRSRHKSVSIIYLTQEYYQTPKIIRRNCTYFSVFGVSSKGELDLVGREHSLCYDIKEFKEMFDKATKGANDFMFIDRRTEEPLLMLRKNFDNVWDSDEREWKPLCGE